MLILKIQTKSYRKFLVTLESRYDCNFAALDQFTTKLRHISLLIQVGPTRYLQ